MEAALGIKPAKTVVSLATSAICVHIDIGLPGLIIEDRSVTDEVLSGKSADSEAGKFLKNLTANHPAHKALKKKRQAIYNWGGRYTYDWRGAIRLLPAVDLPKYMAEFNTHRDEYLALGKEFVTVWPSIISDMAFKQGAMFKRDDYPTAEWIEQRIRCNLFTSDVPSGDFRVQIADDLADDLHNNYSAQHSDIMQQINKRQVDALVDVMRSISKTCTVEVVHDETTGEIKTERGRLYESTIQKALTLCNTYSEFNVMNDPRLDKARLELAGLLHNIADTASGAVEVIRDSDAIRERVKREVDDILSVFGGV
jgi:hypothetical protein